MNESANDLTQQQVTHLQALGAQLRARRKSLAVNATVAAEAAGMSRVTLHRIEKGEPTVAMGAWAHLAVALGLELLLQAPQPTADAAPTGAGWIPVRIALSDYPQLKALAWQVHGVDVLRPNEAFDIYERNARHLDAQAMQPQERDLWLALQEAFAVRGKADV
jgi:transcriptional regulator with XRE-family HTH domain